MNTVINEACQKAQKEFNMNVVASKQKLSGSLSVPGSKSHTIRAILLASLAQGISKIYNPLPSADGLACMEVVKLFGAQTVVEPGLWTVISPQQGLQVPSQVVHVGNSGSVLYFMTPIAATLAGWTVMTGDSSICTRPIQELLNALNQLNSESFTTRIGVDAPPAVIKGPIQAGRVELEGNLSQYISGILMASTRIAGTTTIQLRDPKETPFLKMTCDWLTSLGVQLSYSDNFTSFEITGPQKINNFERTIPSDWEAVAFPLVAAIITDSNIEIEHVDCTGSQGDEAIVTILKEMGADIELDTDRETLIVNGRGQNHSTIRLTGGTFNCAGFPDAVPSLSVAACFAHGTTTLTDIGVCRLKETDRIALMKKELTKLGAHVEEGPDYLVIHGDGGKSLRGALVHSYDDHRIAMALAVMGLGLPKGSLTVTDAECSSVSFPNFFEIMNDIGAQFTCLNN